MRIIHVLRKPLSEGTVAANTLRHGTGGLNIDASRIASDGSHMRPFQPTNNDREVYGAQTGFQPTNHAGGRWPANVILQHLDGCRCDGTRKIPAPKHRKPSAGDSKFCHGDTMTRPDRGGYDRTDDDGKETVANWICEPGCPVARLDEQSGQSGSNWSSSKGTGLGYHGGHGERGSAGYNDTGGASRFYKQVGGKTSG